MSARHAVRVRELKTNQLHTSTRGCIGALHVVMITLYRLVMMNENVRQVWFYRVQPTSIPLQSSHFGIHARLCAIH